MNVGVQITQKRRWKLDAGHWLYAVAQKHEDGKSWIIFGEHLRQVCWKIEEWRVGYRSVQKEMIQEIEEKEEEGRKENVWRYPTFYRRCVSVNRTIMMRWPYKEKYWQGDTYSSHIVYLCESVEMVKTLQTSFHNTERRLSRLCWRNLASFANWHFENIPLYKAFVVCWIRKICPSVGIYINSVNTQKILWNLISGSFNKIRRQNQAKWFTLYMHLCARIFEYLLQWKQIQT